VTRVVIALGSNLGDRHAQLREAVERLQTLLADVRVSGFIETIPAPPADPDQPPYLNAAVVGLTTLTAREMLEALLTIEREAGRARPFAGAARTLDLDLILFEDGILDEPGLQVPHPRFRERRFVLEPLASIAPDLIDPVSGLTVRELLEQLPRE
jgi:2-amino-4-hydroxy-6-hydroxymethyldihydropteridine diphosphokinase